MTAQTPETTQRAYARFAGLMYLAVLTFDVAGAVVLARIRGGGSFVEASHRVLASETLYRLGLCSSLAGSLATVLLAAGLYVAVRPAGPNLALVALLFRVVESAVGAAAIAVGFATLQLHLEATRAGALDAGQLSALADLTSRASGVGTSISAIFFSLGSTVFFWLFLRSGLIPRALAAWGVFASLLYAAAWLVGLVLPQSSLVPYASAPILVGELSTALWLLIAGIRTVPAPAPALGTS
jgi:hypothetical protein